MKYIIILIVLTTMSCASSKLGCYYPDAAPTFDRDGMIRE